jgi:hypothetical protein
VDQLELPHLAHPRGKKGTIDSKTVTEAFGQSGNKLRGSRNQRQPTFFTKSSSEISRSRGQLNLVP